MLLTFFYCHHFSLVPLAHANSALLRQLCYSQDTLPHYTVLKDTATSRSAELTGAQLGWPPFSRCFCSKCMGDQNRKTQMCHVNSQLSAVHQKMILDHKVIDMILTICL